MMTDKPEEYLPYTSGFSEDGYAGAWFKQIDDHSQKVIENVTFKVPARKDGANVLLGPYCARQDKARLLLSSFCAIAVFVSATMF